MNFQVLWFFFPITDFIFIVIVKSVLVFHSYEKSEIPKFLVLIFVQSEILLDVPFLSWWATTDITLVQARWRFGKFINPLTLVKPFLSNTTNIVVVA